MFETRTADHNLFLKTEFVACIEEESNESVCVCFSVLVVHADCLSYKCLATAYLSGQMNHGLIGSNELSCLSLFLATLMSGVVGGAGESRESWKKACCFNSNAAFSFSPQRGR